MLYPVVSYHAALLCPFKGIWINSAYHKITITCTFICILEWGLVEKNQDIDKGIVKYSDNFGLI